MRHHKLVEFGQLNVVNIVWKVKNVIFNDSTLMHQLISTKSKINSKDIYPDTNIFFLHLVRNMIIIPINSTLKQLWKKIPM